MKCFSRWELSISGDVRWCRWWTPQCRVKVKLLKWKADIFLSPQSACRALKLAMVTILIFKTFLTVYTSLGYAVLSCFFCYLFNTYYNTIILILFCVILLNSDKYHFNKQRYRWSISLGEGCVFLFPMYIQSALVVVLGVPNAIFTFMVVTCKSYRTNYKVFKRIFTAFSQQGFKWIQYKP